MRVLLFLFLILTSLLAQAGTVYKSIGPDGKVVYSDHPPADNSKVEKTLNIRNFPTTELPASVLKYREEMLKSMKSRTAEAGKPADANTAVLFMAPWCGYCKKAKIYLAEKRIPYKEHDIDTQAGMQAMVLAGLSGGIPILLKGQEKIQGFSRDGYDSFFSARR